MVTASQQFAANGQQFNIGGYSYGSAEAADLAYAVAQNGGHVDNLVLVGAPINRDLLTALQNNPNIVNTLVITLPKDPIYAGIDDVSLAKTLPTLMGQIGNNTGHFYYSATGQVGQQRDAQLAATLMQKGVK